MSSKDQLQSAHGESRGDRVTKRVMNMGSQYMELVRDWEEKYAALSSFNDTIPTFAALDKEANDSGRTPFEVMRARFPHSDDTNTGSRYITETSRSRKKICAGLLMNRKKEKGQLKEEIDLMTKLLNYKFSQMNKASAIVDNEVAALPGIIADNWLGKDRTQATEHATDHLEETFGGWVGDETATEKSSRKEAALRAAFGRGIEVNTPATRRFICHAIDGRDITAWSKSDINCLDEKAVKSCMTQVPLSDYVPRLSKKLDLIRTINGGHSNPGYRLNLTSKRTDSDIAWERHLPEREAHYLSFEGDSRILDAMFAGERKLAEELKAKVYDKATKSISKIWHNDKSKNQSPLSKLVTTFRTSEEMQTEFKNRIGDRIDDMITSRYYAGISGLEEISNTLLLPSLEKQTDDNVDIVLEWINPDSRFSMKYPAPESISVKSIIKMFKPDFETQSSATDNSPADGPSSSRDDPLV